MLHFRPPENSVTQDNTPYFAAYIAMWVGLLGGVPFCSTQPGLRPAGRRAPSCLEVGGGKETRTAGLLGHCYLEGASPRGLSGVVASGWLVLLRVSSGILSRSPKKGVPAEAVLAHQYSRMWDTGPPFDERVPTAC